jgi:hypothetical protein
MNNFVPFKQAIFLEDSPTQKEVSFFIFILASLDKMVPKTKLQDKKRKIIVRSSVSVGYFKQIGDRGEEGGGASCGLKLN